VGNVVEKKEKGKEGMRGFGGAGYGKGKGKQNGSRCGEFDETDTHSMRHIKR
jgi:hypothetical protein